MAIKVKPKIGGHAIVQLVEIDPILPLRQVLGIVPVSKTTWYQGIKEGRFPRPLQISAKRVGWLASQIKRVVEDAAISGGQI